LTQGTVSIIFGCHSPIHSIQVIRAWIKIYGRLPSFKEIICIFLHDVGHIGLNYLDNYEEKKTHWKLGAKIARFLFGDWGYSFIGGHCSNSGLKVSKLYYADKLSWLIAPSWWLATNRIFEPKLGDGLSISLSAKKFKKDALEHLLNNIKNGEMNSLHNIYLKRVNNEKI
jgi:hypothetical protein